MKFTLLIIVFLLEACQSSDSFIKQPKKGANSTIIGSEDFWNFHARFLNDSIFQANRYIDTSKQVDERYFKIQHLFAIVKARSIRPVPSIDTVFLGYSLTVSGDSVVERIFNDGGKDTSRRIFKRLVGKWYLTKYEEVAWLY